MKLPGGFYEAVCPFLSCHFLLPDADIMREDIRGEKGQCCLPTCDILSGSDLRDRRSHDIRFERRHSVDSD